MTKAAHGTVRIRVTPVSVSYYIGDGTEKRLVPIGVRKNVGPIDIRTSRTGRRKFDVETYPRGERQRSKRWRDVGQGVYNIGLKSLQLVEDVPETERSVPVKRVPVKRRRAPRAITACREILVNQGIEPGEAASAVATFEGPARHFAAFGDVCEGLRAVSSNGQLLETCIRLAAAERVADVEQILGLEAIGRQRDEEELLTLTRLLAEWVFDYVA